MIIKTIEEKAKAYDTAFGRAKECYIDGLSLHQPVKEVLEHIFPELRESEDEKIRKELISFVRGMIACHDKPNAERDEKYESWIAWLEKLSEQKLTNNKVEPKFKVGDKIRYLKDFGTIMTIEKIENGEYIFSNNMGHTTIESGNEWYLVNPVEK